MNILFYILLIFPFVKWFGFGTGSDVQPFCLAYTIILFFVYAIKNKIIITRHMKGLYLLILISIFITFGCTLFFDGGQLTGVARYVFTYSGLVIYISTSYYVLTHDRGINESIIKIGINIYFIVGFIQRFINSDFMFSWISNARTSANRGAIGLCAEPSFYGYMCVFFLVFALDFKKKKMFYIFNLLIQIVFLARSSVTILYLGIFIVLLALYYIRRMSLRQLLRLGLITIGVMISVYYLLHHINSNSRLFYFINILIEGGNIFEKLLSDGSVAIRFRDISFCLEGFITNWGIPHGFSAGKMSSGYGSLIFTMGFMGVALIIYIWNIMRKVYYNAGYKEIIPYFIVIIMFSSIQLSNPIFGFMLGYCVYILDFDSEREQQLHGE